MGHGTPLEAVMGVGEGAVVVLELVEHAADRTDGRFSVTFLVRRGQGGPLRRCNSRYRVGGVDVDAKLAEKSMPCSCQNA